MAFKFNTDNQVESAEQQAQLPLIHTYMGRNKKDKETVFLCNEFKLSSSEEWVIVTVRGHFTILVNVESKVYQELVALMDEAFPNNFGIVCQFNPKSSCRAVFGIDDETLVWWEKETDKDDPLSKGFCNGKLGTIHPNHQKSSPKNRKIVKNTEKQPEA